jgi:hypothetical protein
MNLTNELKIGVVLTLLFVGVVSFQVVRNPLPSGLVPISVPVNTMPSPTKATVIVTPFPNRGVDDESENTAPIPTQTTSKATTTSTSFTASDVAKHSSQNDCWIIIGNGVYNVTNYLYVHPGGAGQIIPYCGADATAAFQSVRRHTSSRAQTDLSSVFIGALI